MLFNSLAFAFFLPVVFVLYWFVFNKNKRTQNTLLIIASYYFYSCWDWRFLFLLVFSTFLDYYTGIQIEKGNTEKTRKFWFWLSISVNLGFLAVFKYYNFFADSFAELLTGIGFKASPFLLDVVLPVGISFYTFHGLSYVIDIYYKRIKAEYNFVDYSLFVSYFPLLVAGPIERATHLLPQVKVKRTFDYNKAKEGLYQLIWGLFKKVVVADNCAFFANQIFDNVSNHSASELWMGMFFFSFQIYGDFSGYSDMALGMSKLFGIDLLKNFNYPYFSRDIADFWRRWHISLSSWFRDYVYIPLGGNKVSKAKQIRNVFAIFLLSGFWHGANWTFIFWGLLHALLFIPLLLSNKNRNSLSDTSYDLKAYSKIILTFVLVSFAWIFFRTNTINDAFQYLTGMFNFNNLSLKYFYGNAKFMLLSFISLLSITFLIFIEWKNVTKGNSEVRLTKTTVFLVLFLLFCMGSYRNEMSFIYFQF